MTTPISDYIGNGYMSVPQALAFGEELDRLIVRKATGDIVFVADAQTGTPVEVMTWNNTGVTLMISGLTQLATIASGATNIVKLSIDSPTGQSVDLAQFLVNGSLKAKIDKDGYATFPTVYVDHIAEKTASHGLVLDSKLTFTALGATTSTPLTAFAYSNYLMVNGGTSGFAVNKSDASVSNLVLTDAGSFKLSAAGPHAVGGDVLTGYQFLFYGASSTVYGVVVSTTLSPASSQGLLFGVDGTINTPAGGDAYGGYFGPNLKRAGSGTHADFMSVGISAPASSAGSATVTNASSLKILGAPAFGTNNYALWVDAGTTRLDGDVQVGATSKLYLDGGSNTYITEASADVVHISAGGSVLYWNPGVGFYPASDNNFYLGYTSNRWAAVYAVNGTIQTSGRDTKQDIEASDLGLDFIMSLQPSKYTYKDEAAKGIRRHGLIAEDVIAAAKGKSLHGLLMEEQHKETGEMHLGLNYAGFVTPLIRAAQDHERRLAKIEALLNV